MPPPLLSEAALCNVALGLIGNRDFLDDINEDSDQGASCRVHYPQVRDLILRSGNWKFATVRGTLALTALNIKGWGYTYATPADFVRDIRLWPPNNGAGDAFSFWPPPGGLQSAGFNTLIRSLGSDQKVPYDLFSDPSLPAGTMVIGTDLQFAELEYVRQVSVVGAFPVEFSDAVAHMLAARLALTIPAKMQLAAGLERLAWQRVWYAISLQQNLGKEDQEPDSPFIRGR